MWHLALELGERIGLTYDGDVLDAYADFCLTFLREQSEFLNTGVYRNAAEGFEKVKHEVYENDEYMTHYMLGHLLSCAVFPHHYHQYRFFMDSFVPATSAAARVFEFGLGHALWFSSFLRGGAARHGDACDISPLCVRLAGQMMAARGIAPESFRLHHADAVRFLTLGDQSYDAMIASGLLEHIEDPWTFLACDPIPICNPGKPGDSSRWCRPTPGSSGPFGFCSRVDEIRENTYRQAPALSLSRSACCAARGRWALSTPMDRKSSLLHLQGILGARLNKKTTATFSRTRQASG